MPDLKLTIESVETVALAATPQLNFRLRLDDADIARQWPIQSVLLHVQIRIEPTRRTYGEVTGPGLSEIFGNRERWGATMRSMLWTHANVMVQSFSGTTVVDMPIECTYDFNIAATKYFAALGDGDIPLCFLFSGTVFYHTDHGIQAEQISWEREAFCRLPVRVWNEMMAHYYPNCAWLCLDKSTFVQLHEFKSRQSLPTWERAIEKLLTLATQEVAAED